ncbi:MAG: N-acetyltransferase [Pedobacter sp.]|nr:MAG: N-acetyltransferase [Pedobacter sp.]
MQNKIHSLSDVQSSNIGKDTFIWQYCVILSGAQIGDNCNINCNVFIENNVVIGNNVTIKPGVQIWDGIHIEDDVFIGPNVTFTNDLVPRSKSKDWELKTTFIGKGASIGANATIIPNIVIGCFAFVGAGSVVTRSIPPYSVWYGNPAKHMGYITQQGDIIGLDLVDKKTLENYKLDNFKPVKIDD